MFSRMAFVPPNGFNNIDAYPTNPASETELRAQMQGISDQLRDFINLTLLPSLENAETGTSAAERLGSAEIESVSGTTVRAQIADLKAQIDATSAGSVTDGSITTAKLADLAVETAKLAAGAVTGEKLGDLAVITAKLADLAVTTAKINNLAVTTEKLAELCVTAAKLAAESVTETKIAAGAVTGTKIANGVVSKSKLGADALAWTAHTNLELSSGTKTIPSLDGYQEVMLMIINSGDNNAVTGCAIYPLSSGRFGMSTSYAVLIPVWKNDGSGFGFRPISSNSETSIGVQLGQGTHLYIYVR